METVFLGLHPTNLGTETREMTNPFTGEKTIAHIGDVATESQVKAGTTLLRESNASEADPDGYQVVELTEDSYLSIAFGPKGGCVNIEGGLESDAIEFLFRLAIDSHMLVTSTIDPDVIAVLPGQRHPGIAGRWPTAVDIESADALLNWVKTEMEAGRIA